METLLTEYPLIENKDGGQFRFVKFVPKSFRLLCWDEPIRNGGGYKTKCQGIHVLNFEEAVLKEIEVWNKLSKKLQEEIKEAEETHKNSIHEKMENARKGRKKKYPHLPREIKCTTCNTVVKIVPGVLAKRLDKLDVTAEKYAETFQCQKCNPTKGKRANPKYVGLPLELVCKCGAKVKLNPYQLDKKAQKEGTTIQQLIKNYQCQKCNPTKGRKKSTKVKKTKNKKSKKSKKK